jgi:hypothetical protein
LMWSLSAIGVCVLKWESGFSSAAYPTQLPNSGVQQKKLYVP